jgi:hypothetical protein
MEAALRLRVVRVTCTDSEFLHSITSAFIVGLYLFNITEVYDEKPVFAALRFDYDVCPHFQSCLLNMEALVYRDTFNPRSTVLCLKIIRRSLLLGDAPLVWGRSTGK